MSNTIELQTTDCNNDETTTKPRTSMYFDAYEALPTASPEEKLEACVQAAIAFVKEQGVSDADAQKMRGVLVGTENAQGQMKAGPAALVTWRLYLCNVGAIVAAKDEIWRPMAGKMTVKGRTSSAYEIALRPHSKEDPSITLAICVQKQGSIQVTTSGEPINNGHFWSYNVIVAQTEPRKNQRTNEEVPGLPLCLAYDVHAALDATGNGKNLTGNFSRKMYISWEPNPLTGRNERIDKMEGLIRGTNDELVILNAMVSAGFPVHTARIDRDPVRQSGQWTPTNRQQPQRQVQTLVGQTASRGVPTEDPFADETA